MLLRAVELVVLCGAAADGASKASSQACSRCCEMRFRGVRSRHNGQRSRVRRELRDGVASVL